MNLRWFRRTPSARLSVLMVCTGNICRSPMAEAVLRHKLQSAGLGEAVRVDSAGTHGFHKGSAPDPRAVSQAARRGYKVAGLKSRPLVADDFNAFDLILAMDRSNLSTLQDRCPLPEHGRLGMLLAHHPRRLASDEVPDPYYGPVAGFDLALDLIEPACDGLLTTLRQRLTTSA